MEEQVLLRIIRDLVSTFVVDDMAYDREKNIDSVVEILVENAQLREMRDRSKVRAGQIVQLNPDTVKNPMFMACMMVVTEVKDWGVQGYVQALGKGGTAGGQAYYRAEWEEFEPVGFAEWVVEGEAT